jgi:hypothetical protein
MSYAALTIMLVYTLHKGYTMETLKEQNMLYNSNLELLHSFANISINKNNMLYIVLLVSMIVILKKASTITVSTKKKHSMYLVENVVFYTAYYFNTYYIPKKETHFPLHDSVISAIHPILTIAVYIFVMYIVYEKMYSEQQTSKQKKITIIYYLTIFTTLLGSVWASSTEGWGGTWIWDPTEILLLLLILFLMIMLHSKKPYIIHLVYTTVLIMYYQLITKLSISDGIHNFYTNELSTNRYYLSFVVCSIIAILVPALGKKIPKKRSIGISILFLVTTYYALKNYSIINSVYTINVSFFIMLLYFFYISIRSYTFKSIDLYLCIGVLILVQWNAITIQPGIIIVSYLMTHIFWNNKWITWATSHHLSHYSCILILIMNYLEYKNWSSVEPQTILNSTLINGVNTHVELQKINNSTTNHKFFIGHVTLFLEQNSYTDNSEQVKSIYYNFVTTIPNIVMTTLKSTTVDNYTTTMLSTQTLINLFNNKVLLVSYWIILVLYLTIKKNRKW